MIPKTTDFIEKGRVNDALNKSVAGEPLGDFTLKHPSGSYLICRVANGDEQAYAEMGIDGQVFEHVSVSVNPPTRLPTWDEMNWVKDQFWGPEECVVQYHPPKSVYVNFVPHVLHLWKPKGIDITTPDIRLIGPLGQTMPVPGFNCDMPPEPKWQRAPKKGRR